MENKYIIKVNNNYDFEFEESVSLDSIRKDKNKYNVLDENQSQELEVIHADFSQKKYSIKANGSVYTVEIKDPLDQLITKLGLTVGVKQKGAHLTAPMPGLVIEVQVNEGQEVKEGDALLVLEAMKMENLLLAPKDGTVKTIQVKKGDAVDKRQLLIEIE